MMIHETCEIAAESDGDNSMRQIQQAVEGIELDVFQQRRQELNQFIADTRHRLAALSEATSLRRSSGDPGDALRPAKAPQTATNGLYESEQDLAEQAGPILDDDPSASDPFQALDAIKRRLARQIEDA